MYWIESGQVQMSDLSREAEGGKPFSHTAKTVVVSEPTLEQSLLRRFVNLHMKPEADIATVTTIDARLRSQRDATTIPEGLLELAEEINQLGYTRVFFLTLTKGDLSLAYDFYSQYLEDGIEVD